MQVMSINLFDWDRPPWTFADAPQFDPDELLKRVAERWPETQVEPGCQFLKEAERAERLGPQAAVVVSRLRRNSKLEGPAYRFSFPREGQPVMGLVKRFYLQFKYPDELAGKRDELHAAMLAMSLPGSVVHEYSTDRPSRTPSSV